MRGTHRWILRFIMAVLVLPGLAHAQSSAGGDASLLEMRDAFRRNNTTQLARLLPAARGHALEPLAIYWDMKARLESASPADIRAALDRMAGTYWEDRLRNDWLLLLGRARDWPNFSAELPRFRMNDDRQVSCYALMVDAASGRGAPEQAAERGRPLWHAQRAADDG